MNNQLRTEPMTDEELLEKLNQARKGKFYPSKVMHKLADIARERKCKISELPKEIKEKTFS